MCNPSQAICIEKHYEVRHWTRELRCSEAELYAAVRVVGLQFEDLRQFRSAMPRSAFVANPEASYR